jgi:hypothetical protein
MSFTRFVVLTLASLVAIGASAVQQQRPEPTSAPSTAAPVSDPASAPGTPQATPPVGQAGEAEDAAALIAKANAVAAANANLAATEIAAPATKTMPSPQAQKKAREYGFHAEVYSGKTFFCRDDATVGTRLPSKWCLDAMEFEDYAVQLKIARDLMKSKATCNAGKVPLAPCGGLQ